MREGKKGERERWRDEGGEKREERGEGEREGEGKRGLARRGERRERGRDEGRGVPVRSHINLCAQSVPSNWFVLTVKRRGISPPPLLGVSLNRLFLFCSILLLSFGLMSS